MRLRLNIYLKVSKCPVAGFIASSLTGICQHTHVLMMDLQFPWLSASYWWTLWWLEGLWLSTKHVQGFEHPTSTRQLWKKTAWLLHHTVDGRNPAPVDRFDRWFIPLFIGFQPSKVVQDFFHPQYHSLPVWPASSKLEWCWNKHAARKAEYEISCEASAVNFKTWLNARRCPIHWTTPWNDKWPKWWTEGPSNHSNFHSLTLRQTNVAMDNPPFIDDVQIKPPLIVDFQLPWITAGQVTWTHGKPFCHRIVFFPCRISSSPATHVRYLQSLWCMQNMQSKNPSHDMEPWPFNNTSLAFDYPLRLVGTVGMPRWFFQLGLRPEPPAGDTSDTMPILGIKWPH